MNKSIASIISTFCGVAAAGVCGYYASPGIAAGAQYFLGVGMEAAQLLALPLALVAGFLTRGIVHSRLASGMEIRTHYKK